MSCLYKKFLNLNTKKTNSTADHCYSILFVSERYKSWLKVTRNVFLWQHFMFQFFIN